jgi:hypothetical protein
VKSPIVHYAVLLTLSCLFCLAASVARAAEEDSLDVELKALAGQIKSLVSKREGGPVAVNSFKGASRLRVSTGTEIQSRLAKFLKADGLTLNPDDYRFEVSGTFVDFEDPKTKLLTVKIVARVTDSSADELGVFNRFVFGSEAVPRLLGLTVSTSPNANAEQRSDAFKESLKNPSGEIDGTIIRSSAGQPYGIEIMTPVEADYVSRTPTKDSKGRILVGLKKSEVFAIQLHNTSDHEAAVKLTIDGINTFHFSQPDEKTQKKSEFWIVPANDKAIVYGWHVNNTKSLEFKVVDFPDSVAAELNIQPSETIGSITASFSAAWTDDANKPADEPPSRAAGKGNEIGVDIEQVTRFIGQARSIITVRYEP